MHQLSSQSAVSPPPPSSLSSACSRTHALWNLIQSGQLHTSSFICLLRNMPISSVSIVCREFFYVMLFIVAWQLHLSALYCFLQTRSEATACVWKTTLHLTVCLHQQISITLTHCYLQRHIEKPIKHNKSTEWDHDDNDLHSTSCLLMRLWIHISCI